MIFQKKFRQIISFDEFFGLGTFLNLLVFCDVDVVFWTKILYTLSNNINIDTRQVTNEVIFHPLKLFILKQIFWNKISFFSKALS